MDDIKIDVFNKVKKAKLTLGEDVVVEGATSKATVFVEPDLFSEDEFEAAPETEEDVWEKAVNEEKPLWENFGLERNMRAMYPKSQYQK